MSKQTNIQRAIQYFQAGNLLKAEEIFRKIWKKSPDSLEAVRYLGLIAYQREDHDSAIRYLKRLIELNPTDAYTYNNLGFLLKSRGLLDEAIEYFKKAIHHNPIFSHALYNLGNALHMRGQLDEAIEYYRKALHLNPKDFEAWNNLGNVFRDKGYLEEAKNSYQKALQINPGFVLAHNNLGTVLHDRGQFEEACKSYQKALDINPKYLPSYNNMGVALREEGRFRDAKMWYEKALAIDPDDPEAHWNMAITSLLEGELEEGWREYEWRLKRKGVTVLERPPSQPRWNGSNAAGRTVLLYAEQGMGDTVHFIRYAPLVAGRGARVIVECQRELLTLVKNVKGVEEVFEKGAELPAFDIWCPLLSLPLLFATKLETIPANVPYLSVQEVRKESWRQRLLGGPSGFRVGLVWAGNPKYRQDRIRSCPLEFLQALSNLDRIVLYSLQKGPSAQQIENPHGGLRIINYMEEANDFEDTAALIANLDLVISVDTAVLHVAGAMGKRTWALLPYTPDWRWMLNRADSPWYPTMRLFRQPKFGDWESVIQNILRELIQEIK
ncbi:MAG: tetratricopeptide repeat protein [Thermodesulfovibrionales bacterium]|nr:tetratricopeptide repeat protein [Thermodesulfovibrionales bacterium]